MSFFIAPLRILSAIFLVFFCLSTARAEEKIWRALYIEGGPFSNYQQTLAYTARGLETLGLISNAAVPIPSDTDETRGMWTWLAENAKGRITFLHDGHYSADWDSASRERIKNAVIERVRKAGDVDLIIAMGTWSGLDMVSEDLGIPVFSMSVTDAVGAGIVASSIDSGRDNVHAQLEPGRFRRQLQMFHQIFKFKKLGVPYEDSLDGRNTAAMSEIEAAAAELGVEIVRATAPLDLADTEEVYKNLSGCIERLLPEIDALYLTYNSVPAQRITELLAPVNKAGIPSFSQEGSEDVEYGVLLSLAQADFRDIGQFEAEAIAEVIAGKKAREVSQIFEPPLGLAINLKTAVAIGWHPPLEILAAVDEIYYRTPSAGD